MISALPQETVQDIYSPFTDAEKENGSELIAQITAGYKIGNDPRILLDNFSETPASRVFYSYTENGHDILSTLKSENILRPFEEKILSYTHILHIYELLEIIDNYRKWEATAKNINPLTIFNKRYLALSYTGAIIHLHDVVEGDIELETWSGLTKPVSGNLSKNEILKANFEALKNMPVPYVYLAAFRTAVDQGDIIKVLKTIEGYYER